MKKLTALALVSVGSMAQADILFTATAGANLWQAESSGYVDAVSLDKGGLNIDAKSKMNLYVSFEHPVPFIPNVKVATTNLNLEGKSNQTVEFRGESFSGDAVTKLDLSHTDLTLYWGAPLPIPYLDINFGLTVRNFDGGAEVMGTVKDSTSGTESTKTKVKEFNQVLPMLYGGVKLGAFFGVYAYADMNYIGYSDNSISDVTAAIGYELPVPVVDINLEAGYRQLALKTDIDKFVSDVDISGPFGGVKFSIGF